MTDKTLEYPNLSLAFVTAEIISLTNHPPMPGDLCTGHPVQELSITLGVKADNALRQRRIHHAKAEIDAVMVKNGVMVDGAHSSASGMTIDKPFDSRMLANYAYCARGDVRALAQALAELQEIGKASPVRADPSIIATISDICARDRTTPTVPGGVQDSSRGSARYG